MKRFLQLTAIIFTLAACGEKDQTIQYAGRIESDVQIELSEKTTNKEHTLLLNCVTDMIYPCSNYTIGASVTKYFKNITINLNGIYTPDFGFMSDAPASATVDLGALSEGVYDLNIIVERKSNSGKLIITPTDYSIEMESTKGMRIANSPLARSAEQ